MDPYKDQQNSKFSEKRINPSHRKNSNLSKSSLNNKKSQFKSNKRKKKKRKRRNRKKNSKEIRWNETVKYSNSKSSKNMMNNFKKNIFLWKNGYDFQRSSLSISEIKSRNLKKSVFRQSLTKSKKLLVNSKSKPQIKSSNDTEGSYKRHSLRESQLLSFSQRLQDKEVNSTVQSRKKIKGK